MAEAVGILEVFGLATAFVAALRNTKSGTRYTKNAENQRTG